MLRERKLARKKVRRRLSTASVLQPKEVKKKEVIPKAEGHITRGIASYYADFFDGRTTASGEIFYNSQLTAAHPTLAFGTVVIVKNLGNEKEVEVKINDRGPFVKGRIIDLSQAAFSRIGELDRGLLEVEVRKK